jgi:methyl-accepting chemotaxis protein
MVLGFGVVILLAIIMAVFAVTQTSSINEEYEMIFAGSVSRRGSANTVQSEVRGIRRVVNGMVMHAAVADDTARNNSLNSLDTDARRFYNAIRTALAEYDYSVANHPGQTQAWREERFTMSRAVDHFLIQYMGIVDSVLRYAREGNHPSALQVTVDGIAIVDNLVAETNNMVATANRAMETNTGIASDNANQAVTLIIVFAIAVVIVAIVIAMIVAGTISKPVKGLVSLTSKVADGQLNINIDRSRVTKDEIGVLTSDVYSLIDTIRGMVDDISILSSEIDQKGDLDYRVDANKYRGTYGEMMSSLNLLCDGFIGETKDLLNGLESINDGNFDVQLKKLPGKKIVLNNTFDALISNLNSVGTDVKAMIDAAATKGDMGFSVDAKKYKGDWNEMVQGLNNIAAAVNAPLTEIRSIMGKLSNGDFGSTVSGKYAGDFAEIQNAVNATISTLNNTITEVSSILSGMAGGDLTRNISTIYVGSFSEIKDSINNIAETLRKNMSEITAASEYVLEGAKRITSNAMELADGSQTQAASLEELNTTVEMINIQTRQFADNAREANTLSNKSTSNAQEGNEAMKQMLSAMMQIKDSSNNISKIIKVIQDIAFQTNLLALNAAVEAARAGEHGKGFAVVAEEVRSLAARSQDAAAETTNMINDSITRVESGTSIAEVTSESLDSIVTSANEVLELINNITNAANEQADTIAQISTTLLDTATTVQNNSKFAQEAAATAEELNSQSEMLQQLVSFFKL